MGKVLGGIGRTLFGGPAKSKSYNTNNDQILGGMQGAMGGANEAHSLMSSVLNGGPGGFADSGGFKFLLNQGTEDVNSNMASRGLLNSGADMKGLETMRNGLASTYLDKYLGHVTDMGNMGVGAGGVIADAGKRSKEQGAKKGIAGTIIKMAAAASDRRLKTKIEKVGEYEDGLGRYRWNYIDGHGLPTGRQEGVMADEVATLRPWAYIPNFMGEYSGVDYGRL